jgi:hypothetical protein
MKTLLTQDEVYAPLLLKFLDSTDNARIAWVQDIATKRYEHAAQPRSRSVSGCLRPRLSHRPPMLIR